MTNRPRTRWPTSCCSRWATTWGDSGTVTDMYDDSARITYGIFYANWREGRGVVSRAIEKVLGKWPRGSSPYHINYQSAAELEGSRGAYSFMAAVWQMDAIVQEGARIDSEEGWVNPSFEAYYGDRYIPESAFTEAELRYFRKGKIK